MRGKAPLVLGLVRLACAHRSTRPAFAFAESEHQLVYGRDGVVEAQCLFCGHAGYALPLAVAGAVLLDKREGA